MDENNKIFKHATEFHEFRTAVAAEADLQHARMAKEVTQSSPRPSGKSVIFNEYESGKASPNDTIFTTTPLESSRKGRRCTISNGSRTGLTSRAGHTFSPIQNESKVQETAKYRDEDEANKQ